MDDNPSCEDNLLQKHRTERKQLQAEIQKLKHAVPKGDKKRKKEVTLQIAQLEMELNQKQEEELKEHSEQQLNEVSADMEELKTEDSEAKVPKKSKAQKRREKKEQDARDREERIKAGNLDNLQGPRHLELKALKQKLKDRELAVQEVPSDGDCLYAAILHQLQTDNITYTVTDLRKIAADYMRNHPDDFLPFLCNTDTGDPYTPEQFIEYCNKLESTPEWGGQLEIQALSSSLQCPIEVIQADSPSVYSGQEFTQTSSVILTYHRHTYKLGEHYNAVKPRNHDDSEEEVS